MEGCDSDCESEGSCSDEGAISEEERLEGGHDWGVDGREWMGGVAAADGDVCGDVKGDTCGDT